MSPTPARDNRARTPQPRRAPMEFSSTINAVIHALADMPMATTDVLSAAIGRPPRDTRRLVEALSEKRVRAPSEEKYVQGAYIGARRRLWLGPSAFYEFNLTARYINTRRGMGTLAARTLPVETIYRMALELDLIRPDATFQWHSGRAYDAVAGGPYHHWGALFWSGVWEDKAAIRRRLYRFGEGLRGEWPAILAFAVPDRWQAQILREVLDQFRLTNHAAIWVVDTDAWQLRPPGHALLGSARWPQPPRRYSPPSPASGRDFARSLEEQLYTGPGGSKSAVSTTIMKVLFMLEQWPGVLPSHIRGSLIKGANGAQIADALFHMEELELATRYDRAYHPGPEAVKRAARRDGVSSRRTSGKQPESLLRLRNHDWPAFKIVAQFQAQGSDIAAGWRAVDDAGLAGKIDPDAVVYLRSGPYGPGWHYFEYERRSKSSKAIAHKLRSTLMKDRSNDWPMVFVVASPNAERLFWEHGKDAKLITAVAQGQKVPREWRCFGERVLLNDAGASECVRTSSARTRKRDVRVPRRSWPAC